MTALAFAPHETAAPPIPAFELSGPEGAPVVIVLGGISATKHVVSTTDDPTPGWWESVAGRGRALDTTRFRVLGVEPLASVQADRVVTTHDQADAIVALLDRLDIERAHAIVGASYGGMVALALAERWPERVERLVVISAAHEAHPMSTAVRAIQRRIVRLGLETGRTHDAMALARALAMTTYRGETEFASRFAEPAVAGHDDAATFEVERYLVHCGDRFAATCPPERYLALSLSGDLHRVVPERIATPAVLVAADGDRLVPGAQMRALARRIGGPRRTARLRTTRGHDAFLTEPAQVARILSDALSTEIIR